MKQQINPVVAVVVVLVVLVAAVVWFMRGGSPLSSTATVDTGLPPEVAKRLREQGPQPMPPMPGLGGNVNAPGSTTAGPPPGK